MGRKRAIGWRARIGGGLLLAALAAGGWAWWQAQHWRPAESEFPVQGVLVGSQDGRPEPRTARQLRPNAGSRAPAPSLASM